MSADRVCAGFALAGLCCACASGPAPKPREQVDAAFELPLEPGLALLPSRIVARGLLNPRGMQLLPSGALLVSEAGTGAPESERSGRLTRLTDANRDGDYDDEGERAVLLGEQPSRNILHIVRRDEVFGMAGMAAGQGHVLVSHAFFGGPSTVFAIDGDRVTTWGSTHGNLNDLSYDAARNAWFGAASTTDEVVRLVPGGGAERVVKLPPLPSGQDAVPGYLQADAVSRELLVTLFTGSPEGEEGGLGVELVKRAGGIISVDPDRKRYRWVVRGLSVPTDLEVGPDGTIYVLELCDAFLDPVKTREELMASPSHGGFKRYSGRLLRVDRSGASATVLAQGLDAPTNLHLTSDALYVAQGMGTPGREIPGPAGIQKLEGFIERFELPR